MEIGYTPYEALCEAVRRLKSQAAMARVCGVSQPAVWKWLQSSKRLPAEHAISVEHATGISRHLLRPDTLSGEQRAQIEADLRTFESPGVRVKNIEQVGFERAFPFSPEIYRQLAFLPAAQHPRLCRGCGWDRWTPQVDVVGNECGFSPDHVDRCTACAVIEARGLRRRAA